VTSDSRTLNVAVEQADPRSVLTLYRRLISLRRAEPALQVGAYQLLCASNEVLAYVRQAGRKRFIVALNLSSSARRMSCPGLSPSTIVLSTALDRERDRCAPDIELRADEGVIALVDEEV
jgi:alpha-glucosidase